MSCDWEGNRRSGVALAMRHRLKWLIHLRAQGLSEGDEHPTNTPHEVWYSLPFTLECGKSHRAGEAYTKTVPRLRNGKPPVLLCHADRNRAKLSAGTAAATLGSDTSGTGSGQGVLRKQKDAGTRD